MPVQYEPQSDGRDEIARWASPLPIAHAIRSATTAVSQPSLLILVEIWNLYICFKLDKILFVVCGFFAPCFLHFLFPNMVCMPIFGKSSFSEKFGKFFFKLWSVRPPAFVLCMYVKIEGIFLVYNNFIVLNVLVNFKPLFVVFANFREQVTWFDSVT